jgi:H+/Cl- antiporter ClcA
MNTPNKKPIKENFTNVFLDFDYKNSIFALAWHPTVLILVLLQFISSKFYYKNSTMYSLWTALSIPLTIFISILIGVLGMTLVFLPKKPT